MAAVAVSGARVPRMDCADNHRRPGQPVVVGGLDTLRFGSMSGSPQSGNDLDALVCLVGRGDVDAFAALYDRTRTRVFGLIVRLLRDPGYSEDTTQEVYLQVWRSAAQFDPAAGSALAWLLTLAHRRAVDRVRSEEAATRRDLRYGAASGEPAADVVVESAIQHDEARRVADCLQSLTDLQRECIELAYYRGLTYVEVSQRLAANLPTVKSRMRDALRGLRTCLGVS